MQLRHFRYFIAVAEEGSFLKAARRLRVAQPSLSKQVQDLEREIGTPLLERLPRGVRLTPAGTAFLAEARATVENAARAVARARRAQEEEDTVLHFSHGRIAHNTSAVADLLFEFRKARPDVTIRIHSMNGSAQRTALREGRLDAAVTLATELPVPGFGSMPFADCSIRGVLLPGDHPLAQESAVSLSELRDLTYLSLPHSISRSLARMARAAMRVRGLVPAQSRPRPTDMSLTRLYITAGNAWTMATDAMAEQLATSDSVVYRPFVEAPISLWLTLIWVPEHASQMVSDLVDAAARIDNLTGGLVQV